MCATLLIKLVISPRLAKFLGEKGYSILPRDAVEYTTNIINQILDRRRQRIERRNDFIQMMIDHEENVKNETETTQEIEDQHREGHQWKTLKKSMKK